MKAVTNIMLGLYQHTPRWLSFQIRILYQLQR